MTDSSRRDRPADAITPTEDFALFRWPHTGETEEEKERRVLLNRLDAVYVAGQSARSIGATISQVVCAVAGPEVRDRLAGVDLAPARPRIAVSPSARRVVADCLVQFTGLMTLSGVRRSELATRLGLSREEVSLVLSGQGLMLEELSDLVEAAGGTIEVTIRLKDARAV